MGEPRYRIGTVSRLTGVSTHLIRIWERRYEALDPGRSGGGARLYSPADVARLRLLKGAVDRGHPIGQVARLEPEELERLGGSRPENAVSDHVRSFIDEFMAAVEAFDGERAEQLLARESLSFSPRSLVFEVLGPLLHQIGGAWENGKLCIASEHIASALIRDTLTGLLRRIPRNPQGEIVAVATPAGERHELGALLAAVTIGMQSGYRILYLGADLPDAEICRAVRASKASVLALSVVSLEAADAAVAVRGLVSELPEEVEVVLGGTVSQQMREAVGSRVLVPGSLRELEHWLETRRKRSRGSGAE